jgi:ribonuclease P protein component
MKASMQKRDIIRVNRSRPSLKARFFLFKHLPNDKGKIRVSFVFPRKVGNAVLRNRFKRRLRELFRVLDNDKQGYDVMCLAMKPLSKITDKQWQDERLIIRKWFEDIQGI